ncbi:MAG TPA: hypothetical protein EYG18_11540 [Micavibrio sp.]|nr:hypothetical protein [Micavibrio sp.]HIL29893.1 hypothetical protein [Micavibrio sp.]
MRLIFTLIALLSFSLSESAYALSCISLSTQELLQKSDIIFLGVAQKSEAAKPTDKNFMPNSYTRFKIDKIYKGDLNDTVDIHHHRKSSWPLKYEKGTEYIIFANRSPETDLYVTSRCTPRLTADSLSPADPESRLLEGYAKRWAALETHKGKLDALDALIKKFPNNAWLYVQKGEILEEFGDYRRAVSAYKTALDKEPNWHDVTSRTNFQKAYLGYGKALFYSEQYQEALPYLKKTAEQELKIINYQTKMREAKGADYEEPNYDYVRGATKLYAASLIYLNDNEALNELKVDVSGMTFKNTTFSNLSFVDANFSNTHLKLVTFENTNFQGANFSNASINGRFENTDFVGANFTNANLNGHSFKNVNFSNAHFDNSKIGASHMKVPVENVNFTNAKLINSEIMFLENETVNYESAIYDCNTRFPDDFSPVENGMLNPQEECPTVQ